YPRDTAQPIREDQLLTGPLEPTNEAYAIAKIAGIKLCEAYRSQYGDNFISAMPTNLYGPNDNFDPIGAHLVPMLIRRFDQARHAGDTEVTVWGTGRPRRELMHVDDLASACVHLMHHYNSGQLINVGTGTDTTVEDIASLVRDVVHPTAHITFDTTKPDGAPQKLLDVTRIHDTGWHHTIALNDGLRSTYDWYLTAEHIRNRKAAATTA
ncbi:MAG: NAD-dependent epimerase/dehydratase family protein, partial [Ilumatobacteraceae bacterium]|nr:NAD-dependent epimerase/dehydratase family protein [Ilumatobacteraceae bacterium]